MNIMTRLSTRCRRCLHRHPCRKEAILPPVGDCSVPEHDRRSDALRRLHRAAVENGGSVSLRESVTVQRDELGFNSDVRVRRVSVLPYAPQDAMCLRIGEDTTTDDVTTEELETILSLLKN